MAERRHKVRPEDVLGVEDLQLLSKEAARVFASVWQSMNHHGELDTFTLDEDLSWRARVALSDLEAAKAELVAAGLLRIVPRINSEGAKPGSRYWLIA